MLCSCWLLSPGVAAGETFFTGLDGNWQGQGFIRTERKAPEENIRCRLNNGLSKLQEQLFVRGSCSIAGFMLPVNGSIVEKQRDYSADLFRNLVQVTTSSFSGRRSGNSLTLHYSGMDLTTREAVKARMTIIKRGSGFDISLHRTDRQSNQFFPMGTIRFRAR